MAWVGGWVCLCKRARARVRPIDVVPAGLEERSIFQQYQMGPTIQEEREASPSKREREREPLSRADEGRARTRHKPVRRRRRRLSTLEGLSTGARLHLATTRHCGRNTLPPLHATRITPKHTIAFSFSFSFSFGTAARVSPSACSVSSPRVSPFSGTKEPASGVAKCPSSIRRSRARVTSHGAGGAPPAERRRRRRQRPQ